MQFLDANIFLRYIVDTDQAKAKACRALFRKARTKAQVFTTSEAIIAEVVFVLVSKRQYHLPRKQIRVRLIPLLSLPGLKLPHRKTLLKALKYFVHYPQMDFEDCLTVAHMERQKLHILYSYDRDFDGVDVIERVEPAEIEPFHKTP